MQAFQLWYMEGNQTIADFQLMDATLVADNIDATQLTYTIANLAPETNFTFFLIPEDVAVDANNPNAASICTIQTSTTNAGNTCAIPLDANMIFDPFISLQNATRFIDEQNDVDPFCEPNLNPNSFWGFDFPADMSMTQERLSLDLDAYYHIDIVALFDGGGIGELEVQRAESPNGPWTTILDYPTISTNDWTYFTDLFPSNQPVRYLRFIASADDMVQLGELFLCGELSTFNPNIPPGVVQNATIIDNSCNSVTIDVTAPFDNDIAQYQVNFGGNTRTFPFTGSQQTLAINELPSGTNFNFSIITVDNIGQESDPFVIATNTFPSADCETNCSPLCPTQLCLKPSWVTDLTPIKPEYDPTRLVDEQATAPVCGNGSNPTTEWGFEFDPTDGVPPVIARLDLQAEYNLDSIFLFDGNAAGTFIVDYLDAEGIWQPLINHFSTPFNEWVLFEHPEVHARFLRLTKMEIDANINEIVIHASLFEAVDPPSSNISNFEENNIECNEADLNWTLPTNSNITSLALRVATTTSLVDINLPANTDFYTLTNLLPATVYEVFLFAENASTTPTDLNIVTFQTPPRSDCESNSSPDEVTNFQIVSTGCEEIGLSWTQPNDSDIVYYELTVQPGNQLLQFPPQRSPVTCTVNNLDANTNYQFEIKSINFGGAESPTQSVSGTTLQESQCNNSNNNGNCNTNCPTFICVEESWINDLTPTENLDARRLFDEPNLGNPVCGESGMPSTNWGEEYTPGLGIPPIVAEVDLQQAYNLESIYLFDVESDGNFRIEYLGANDIWIEITTYYTAPYNVWTPFDNLNITTQRLRFSKLNNSAKIAEVAIFGTPLSN